MFWLLAGIGIFLGYLVVKEMSGGKGFAKGSKLVHLSSAVGLGAVAALLVVTGKIVIAAPVAAGALYFVRQGTRTTPPGHKSKQKQGKVPAFESSMSVQEACRVLGLREEATVNEIKAAHKKLMIKMHPDHGGSNYLAIKINEAKDLLLSRKP